MRLKISMRDREAERPSRPPLKTLRPGYAMAGLMPNPYHSQNPGYGGYGQGNGHPGEGPGSDIALNEGLGRNEGTVRFLFGADWD